MQRSHVVCGNAKWNGYSKTQFYNFFLPNCKHILTIRPVILLPGLHLAERKMHAHTKICIQKFTAAPIPRAITWRQPTGVPTTESTDRTVVRRMVGSSLRTKWDKLLWVPVCTHALFFPVFCKLEIFNSDTQNKMHTHTGNQIMEDTRKNGTFLF